MKLQIQKILLFVCISLLSTPLFSQIKGRVFEEVEHTTVAFPQASIYALSSNQSTQSDSLGYFSLSSLTHLDTIVISFSGYLSDTVYYNAARPQATYNALLIPMSSLGEYVVIAKRRGSYISRMEATHMEIITSHELRKAACCNLSESFETNVSVDVNLTDAVSGSKKIQMMGIDGVYTQIQMENIPYLRGMESAFGLNSIPGTWVESIQVTKGTGNVVNGYESMAGLINVELKKPQEMEKFYFNAFGNIYGRGELNTHGRYIFKNDKWSTAYFIHGASMRGDIDQNKDGFRDLPQSNNISLLNRWNYSGHKFEAQFGLSAYTDSKDGGSTKRSDLANPYLVDIDSKNINLFAKTGFLFENRHHQSIGIIYNLKLHQTDALFGNRTFQGTEKRGYINAIYNTIIGNTNHGIKTGLSLVYADITQDLKFYREQRIEIVPGAFLEYTWTGIKHKQVFGIRNDYHSIYGNQISPRYHGKFTLHENLDLRLTAGRGFRVSNVGIDNLSLLATSRMWHIATDIRPEVSWNMGGSLIQRFHINNRAHTVTLDYYHTLFENQLIVDHDRDAHAIYFDNLNGRSYSNALQIEWNMELARGLDLKLGYKLLDVKATYADSLQQQVMVPKHRTFANIGYITRNKKWEFDMTLNVFGKSRLHTLHMDQDHVTENTYSSVFPTLNAQVTYVYKKWDFYVGGENLTNYTQNNPIISSQDPYGTYFDATRVWAPILGTNVYFGVRYKLVK